MCKQKLTRPTQMAALLLTAAIAHLVDLGVTALARRRKSAKRTA